mmetsp:Transcript_56790/g.136427  ORF Transcript_56790/g.136427 Transcript_56790/m.136427 type:complete len:230 (+) Transcript_56790:212-901(+)
MLHSGPSQPSSQAQLPSLQAPWPEQGASMAAHVAAAAASDAFIADKMSSLPTRSLSSAEIFFSADTSARTSRTASSLVTKALQHAVAVTLSHVLSAQRMVSHRANSLMAVLNPMSATSFTFLHRASCTSSSASAAFVALGPPSISEQVAAAIELHEPAAAASDAGSATGKLSRMGALKLDTLSATSPCRSTSVVMLATPPAASSQPLVLPLVPAAQSSAPGAYARGLSP